MRLSAAPLRLLSPLAVVLIIAFAAAPPLLAGSAPTGGSFSEQTLIEAVHREFVQYWATGVREFPSGLDGLVEYWFRFHLIKGAIAAILLAVLAALGVRLWKAFLRAADHSAVRRAGLVSAGVAVTTLGFASLVALIANIQGAMAPFASLLPMLTLGTPDEALAGTLDEIRTGQTTPALDAMISDFARYHAAMAVIAAITAVAFTAISVLLWKRFRATAPTARRPRRLLRSFGMLTALTALALIVVAVANTTTAVDPVPALLAFFNGSR